ncbi:hypothetical protein [Spirosoma aerolatum]|uniref:hypothetical protein n=1 Tax=Spirosoma aerolatum TaxID=1211326 RepID=UPI0009AE8F4F|nr:hypothetical protein [Spirosoma aerolatum]
MLYKNPEVKPTIGRIVHYVPFENSIEASNHAKEVPAIVVAAWGEGALVNLKVFTDGIYDTWRPSTRYSEEKEPGTWHWPERE